MKLLVLLCVLSVNIVHALVLGSCRNRHVASPSRVRAHTPTAGFFDFFKDDPPLPPVETFDNPCDFTTEELQALSDATICLEQPGRDMKDPPQEILDGSFRNFAQSYAELIRKPSMYYAEQTEPPAAAWDVVRKRWPVLAEKSNEELLKAAGPFVAFEVDFRQLPQPPWRPPSIDDIGPTYVPDE